MLAVAILISSILTPQPTNAARSISARRVRNPATSTPDRYDRSITTFSPEGRLQQLEYALIAAEERGWGLTVCVEWEGAVVFAFPSDGGSAECDASDEASDAQDEHDSEIQQTNSPKTSLCINTEHNPSHNTKVHRLSPTHLLLTSGLAGDSRALASAFRRLIASWTHINYGETISVREVAREVGIVRHGIGLRTGARVLGVVGLIIGLEDTDDAEAADENLRRMGLGVEVRMYKSLPGGTIDRCNICCTGGGADSLGRLARKDAIEALSQVLASKNRDVDKTISENIGEVEAHNLKNVDSSEIELLRIVEEVGKIALKHHPFSNPDEVDGTVTKRKQASVDIWVIRAAPANSSNGNPNVDKTRTTEATGSVLRNKGLGPSFVSPHRRLGQATLNLRYARRIRLEQLTQAAKCLILSETRTDDNKIALF